MKESERLRAAKQLISTPDTWLQGNYTDAPDSAIDGACKFCSLGAIFKARGENCSASDYNSTSAYLRKVLATSGHFTYDVAEFNDCSKHEDVLYLFDKAIEFAESEGC